MTMSRDFQQREIDKFKETSAGETSVQTTISEFADAANPVRKDVEGGGKVSVGTTAVEVTFTGTTTSMIITADKDNTGLLFIGKSDVTNLGANAMTFLEAGDSYEIDYDDGTNAIYVVSDLASQNFWKGAAL